MYFGIQQAKQNLNVKSNFHLQSMIGTINPIDNFWFEEILYFVVVIIAIYACYYRIIVQS